MKKIILTLAILGASFCHAQVDKSKYNRIYDFSEGVAKVNKGEKWYIIDTKGNIIKELKGQEIPILTEERMGN